MGNWSAFVQKATGTTSLNQSRSHNKVNEIDTEATIPTRRRFIDRNVGPYVGSYHYPIEIDFALSRRAEQRKIRNLAYCAMQPSRRPVFLR